jgi:hypothetical protein
MNRRTIQIVFGVVVVAAGVLLLLQATGLLPVPGLLWTGLLAAAGIAFWFVFFTQRQSWWAALPGAALLGAAVITVMELDPAGFGQWTEVPMLAALGVGFWAVYLRDRERWWAVIPGGVLLTLAVVAGVTSTVAGQITGAIFLFGLAVTFALVAVLPGGLRRRWWAWIPAGVLAAAGTLALLAAGEWLPLLNYVWPIAVIVAGLFLLSNALQRRRPSEADADRSSGVGENSAPAEKPTEKI